MDPEPEEQTTQAKLTLAHKKQICDIKLRNPLWNYADVYREAVQLKIPVAKSTCYKILTKEFDALMSVSVYIYNKKALETMRTSIESGFF